MPTTRKDDLVTKLPSNFTINETKNDTQKSFPAQAAHPPGLICSELETDAPRV